MERLVSITLEEHRRIHKKLEEVNKLLRDVEDLLLKGKRVDDRVLLGKAARIGIATVELTSMLSEHNRFEKEALFPTLLDRGFSREVERLRKEHTQAKRFEKEALRTVEEYRRGEIDLKGLVEKLKSNLKDLHEKTTLHMRIEEQILQRI